MASYVFAGSEPGLMQQLFENRDRPLYGSAVPMRLDRLRDPDIAAYVVERFELTGRAIGDALQPLLRIAEGHPKQTMLLAHRVWEERAAGGEATLEEWERAFEAALAEIEPQASGYRLVDPLFAEWIRRAGR